MSALESTLNRTGGGEKFVEPNLGSGRRITLREIVDTHFTENADQVYPHFLFINRLFQATGGNFSLSPESLLPILADRQSVSLSPPYFSFFVDLPLYDRTDLESDFGKTLLARLGDSCEPVGLEGNKRIFKMKPLDEFDEQSSTHGKDTPLIVLEEKTELGGINYLSLQFTEDPNATNESATNSTGEPIFSLDFKQHFFITNDGAIDWLDMGRADWVTNEVEPYAYLSDNALRALSQPMNIRNEIYDSPRKFFRDIEFYFKNEVFANPNPDFFNFPIYFTNPDYGEERYVRPYYYLDLALLGAKMTQLSSLVNKDGGSETIADESKNAFKDEMHQFQNSLFMIEFDSALYESGKLTYSPIEYLMYELLWQGVDIWPYMDEFTNAMVQSFQNDSKRFWETVSALGIDQILPLFWGMDETRRDELKSKLKPDSALPILRRVFSLIPSLSPYYDHNPEKENDQSDEYYMQLVLALAAYSYDVGQEPVAAIAVHEGKVIGARRNDTKKKHEREYSRIIIDHSRHAELLLINSLGDELIPGTKLYISLVPCEQCTYHIRRNPNIAQVNCSADSTMGHIESLVDPKLKEKKHDDSITVEPPLVKIGILEDVARTLYDRTGWFEMPIYRGDGVKVIDNRSK